MSCFFLCDAKSTSNKSKTKQVGLIQTKKLLQSNRYNQQNEKATMNWEKIFANCILNKGLIFNIQLIQLYNKTNKKKGTPINLILKWAEEPKRHFSKNIQMVNRFIKRCSMSLINMVTHTETTMRYFTPVRMAIIKLYTWNWNKIIFNINYNWQIKFKIKKKTRDNKHELDMEKRETLYIVGENVNW